LVARGQQRPRAVYSKRTPIRRTDRRVTWHIRLVLSAFITNVNDGGRSEFVARLQVNARLRQPVEGD